MNRLNLVIQREYLTRVRKKSFIILTILMPFLIVSLSIFPLWLSTLNDGNLKNVAVIDNTGIYAPLLKSSELYQFQIVRDADMQETESKVGGELFAILQITDDLSKNPNAVTITSEKQTPLDLQTLIQRTLNDKVTEQRLDELTESGSVDNESISKVRSIIESGSKVSLKTLKMSDDGSVKES